MAKQIAFFVSDKHGVRKGYFSDAELWDYSELDRQLDLEGNIVGAFDWIHYNIALASIKEVRYTYESGRTA